jgi:hypothetical protein
VLTSALKSVTPLATVFPTTTPFGANSVTTVTCSDLHALIDSFLHRRFDLDPNVRFRMADDILRRLKPLLTLPTENTLPTEKLLEALAYERRATGRHS